MEQYLTQDWLWLHLCVCLGAGMSLGENSRETGAFPEVLIKGEDPLSLPEIKSLFMQSPFWKTEPLTKNQV